MISFGRILYLNFVSFLFVMYCPGLPPFDMDFHEVPVEKVDFEEELDVDQRLNDMEILSTEVGPGTVLGKLKGPESFAVMGDYIYTGIIGGDILRLNLKTLKGPWEHVFRHSQEECTHQEQELECGRPLGLAFDRQGRLVVADAGLGVYRYDFKTKKSEMLVPRDLIVEGEPIKQANSLVITKEGIIYFTVPSTRFGLYQGLLETLSISSPNGRLMMHDTNTKETFALVDGVAFANGIALSEDEQSILFNDGGKMGIIKYYIKGDREGTGEIFAKTPGMPDNLKNSLQGRFLTAICVPMPEGKFNPVSDVLFKMPTLRRFLVRIYYNAQKGLEFIHDNLVPNFLLRKVTYWMINFETYLGAGDHYGLLVEYDADGKLVQSWHSPDGKRALLSEGFLHQGYLYFGSPWNEYVGRLKYTEPEQEDY